MESKNRKVSFNKSGGTAGNGGITARVILPITWIRKMGITQENREIKTTFDGKKIIIEKAD